VMRFQSRKLPNCTASRKKAEARIWSAGRFRCALCGSNADVCLVEPPPRLECIRCTQQQLAKRMNLPYVEK
jgi:hypothetical protein